MSVNYDAISSSSINITDREYWVIFRRIKNFPVLSIISTKIIISLFITKQINTIRSSSAEVVDNF